MVCKLICHIRRCCALSVVPILMPWRGGVLDALGGRMMALSPSESVGLPSEALSAGGKEQRSVQRCSDHIKSLAVHVAGAGEGGSSGRIWLGSWLTRTALALG